MRKKVNILRLSQNARRPSATCLNLIGVSASSLGENILLPLPDSPMSVESVKKAYGFQETSVNFREQLKSKCLCDINSIISVFPILKWLPKYDYRKNLLADLIAGLTVSVLQIPHGLAFAPLGGQEPVTGLYMAIFPIIMYVIMGTSRHISLGMMGILIMMVGKLVDSHATNIIGLDNSTLTTPIYSPLEVCIAITFCMGLWQLLLGCLQMGFLCVLLSNSMVSGLTAGASIHIVFLQLKHFFGIPLVMTSGPFKLVYATISFFQLVPQSNLVAVILAFCVMFVLYAFNEFVKGPLSKKCPVPVPMEFILIFIGIGISYGLDLPSEYGVKTVGNVPSGLPTPIIPPFSLMPHIAFDTFVLALINISFNISLAKLFAKKGGYEIQQNQELLAYGASNVLGSFFHALPVSASFSRSAVQFQVGGKTELSHLVSLLSVLIILLGLGSLFANIPLSVLAAIVIVTVKGLIMQITDFPKYWRLSKLDGGVWMFTFIAVLVVDIDYGIAIGLVASVASLVILGLQNEVEVLGHMPGKKYFANTQFYRQAENKAKVLIIKLSGALNSITGVAVIRKIKCSLATFWSAYPDDSTCVIIDLLSVANIDPSTADQFSQLIYFLDENRCTLLLTNCNMSCYKTLEHCDFFSKLSKNNVIMTIEGALNYIEEAKLLA